MADELSNGLSGWAWHELGRGAERAHQARMDVAADFAARLRGEVQVDVGALIDQNQALQARNSYLEGAVQHWKNNYQVLADWGHETMAVLRHHGLLREP